jgi:hypothetical protein
MLALFDWVKNHLAKVVATVFVVAVAIFGQQIQPAQAVGSCSFACQTRIAPIACVSSTDCEDNCRRSCTALGLTVTPGMSGTCDRTIHLSGSPGACTPTCTCTPQVILECERDPTLGTGGTNLGIDGECATQCNNTCSTARFRDRLGRAFVTEVSCAARPAINCVDPEARTGQLAVCQLCIRNCINGAALSGTVGVPSDCYSTCRQTNGQNAACNGVPMEAATADFNSSGAVGGSSGRRSRIQSGTTASTSEAASLPPGACVQRAIATDAAIAGRIEQIEIAFGVTSSTFTCRRVCAEQERGKCVVGGCPGDTSVQCCSPDSGAPPATQCGGRGATTSGAAADGGTGGTTEGGTTDGSTEGGASNSGTPGSSGTTDSTGGTRSSTVGSSNVAADSGGLTRLILPSCIEDGGCQFSDIIQVGLNLVRFLFGLAGVLLLVVFVYAGIEYLIAGDASSVNTATERIKKALLGLFFMFFGYTLVNFMVGLFVRA